MLRIDGSKGEGGGQIVRSALTLSMLTGQPVQLRNVRHGRHKPGLLRQHLTAVQAAGLSEDDFVDASLFLMKNYNEEAIVNVGTGHDFSIEDIAKCIAKKSCDS